MVLETATQVHNPAGNGACTSWVLEKRMEMTSHPGLILRHWRKKRRLSQLNLASDIEISTRHLSYIETGKSRASREMLLRLAEGLDLPRRETSDLLLAAGFAPGGYRPGASNSFAAIETPLGLLLEGHHPYPAIAIDRYWTIRKANRAVAPILSVVSPDLLEGAMNVVRITLHPRGLAPHIINYMQWRHHLLGQLRKQVRLTDDAALKHLLAEAEGYPAPPGVALSARPVEGPVIPLQFRTPQGVLNLISTTTTFGTPVDIEVSELAIETLFPADEETRAFFMRLG